MKPSVGRIVFYHHPGSLDGKHAPTVSPAIIRQIDTTPQGEHDGNVQLFVFGPKGQHQDWATFGDGPCQWSWPPRV